VNDVGAIPFEDDVFPRPDGPHVLRGTPQKPAVIFRKFDAQAS
jgi:hypothetical protein